MSTKTQEGLPQKAKSSRRLMKNALLVLGASVLIQPAGAVFGLTAQETPKKDDKTAAATSTPKKSDKKNTKSSTKKGGKKKEEPQKKEGS
jgi:hypothetical protein